MLLVIAVFIYTFEEFLSVDSRDYAIGRLQERKIYDVRVEGEILWVLGRTKWGLQAEVP